MPTRIDELVGYLPIACMNETAVIPERVLRLSHFTIENAQEPVLLFDRLGQVRRANKSAGQQLGYALPDLNALTFTAIHPAYDSGQYDQLWQRLKQQHTLTLDMAQTRRDGSTRQATYC